MLLLQKIFASKTQSKILGYLLEHFNEEHILSDVARACDVAPSSAGRVIDNLEALGLITGIYRARTIRAFRLNLESPFVPILLEFFEKLEKLD